MRLFALLALALAQDAPLRVYLCSSQPEVADEWKTLLAARGVRVECGPVPGDDVLARTDVVLLHGAVDGARLDAFLKRGGGIVALQEAVRRAPVGASWDPGASKTHRGTVSLHFGGRHHPIARGAADFFVDDEMSWDLRLTPEAQVVAQGFRTAFEITPQMWALERERGRAFACLQGLKRATLALPQVRALVLRGLAWTGRRDVDLLLSADEKASLAYPPGGPVRPGQAGKRIRVPPGFRVELVAAEPDVVRPIALDWDARGRLWAAETPGYPDKAETWKRAPHDRIVILDGEKRKVFYDRLDLVTGLAPFRDGVVVTQAPEILFLRDTDGDDRADRREVLFTGFGFGDTHAVISNLRWGLDGWLYADQGYAGNDSRNVRNAAGKDFGKIGQGIFRFKPDGSAIEPVCSLHESNTWGMDFTWDGEIFASMATNGWHLRHVILPERHLDRGRIGQAQASRNVPDHRDAEPLLEERLHPYVQIDNVRGFSAAAGSCLYDGGAWPAEYDGMHFLCEPAINIIHADRLTPDGVSYRAARTAKEEFAASTDLWFRPVDLQTGPDGAMYVADFYGLAVIHNDIRGVKHGPHNAAVRPDRGHEHGRIWRIQHEGAKPFGPMALDRASISDRVRALEHPNRCRRMTAHRLLLEGGEGAPELAALLASTRSAPAKVHALWLLHLMGKRPEAGPALKDGNPGVRKNAVRIAGGTAALADPDPRVRLEGILASPPHAVEALLTLYPKLEDDVSRTAVLAVASGAAREFIAAGLGRPGVEPLLEALAAGASPAEIVPLLSEKRGAAGVLRRLRRNGPPPAELRALVGSSDPELAAAASAWLRDETPPAVREALFAAAADPKRSDESRARCLEALLEIPSTRGRAIEAAAGLLGSGLQDRALEALGSSADAAVAPAIVGAWGRLSGPLRDRALALLVRRTEWARHLVAEIEAGRFRLSDLGATGIFLLRNHPEVGPHAAKAIDRIRGAETRSKEEILARLKPAVERTGDAARGKAIFAENCLKCHSYRGEGKNAAPDLTGMGVHGPSELLIHIVDPNRVVEPLYVTYNVKTRGGEVLNGTIVRETAGIVVLRNTGGDTEVRRTEIEAMTSTGLSLMPEGMEALGEEALRDLLTYFCGDAGRFRVIDLQRVCTASSKESVYNPLKEKPNFTFKRFGLHTIEGVPFEILDPAKSLNGNNTLVLKGGRDGGAACKSRMPRRVEVEVGLACSKVHLLGGIGPWGSSQARKGDPVVKVTYHYADGTAEDRILHDGVEHAEWMRRADVPGSKYVEGILAELTWGQVRWLTLEPGRREAIRSISLESYDNHTAPTFFALTAERP